LNGRRIFMEGRVRLHRRKREGFRRIYAEGWLGRRICTEKGFAGNEGFVRLEGRRKGFAWKGLHGRGGGSEEKFARKDMEGRFCMEGTVIEGLLKRLTGRNGLGWEEGCSCRERNSGGPARYLGAEDLGGS
jgi:hypothetical protein